MSYSNIKKENLSFTNIKDIFFYACESNNVKEVENICIQIRFMHYLSIHSIRYYGLLKAFEKGSLNVVKYLMTSEVMHTEEIKSVLNGKNKGLISAARFNHKEIIEYIVSNPSFKDYIEPELPNRILQKACQRARLEMVDFLLNSPKMLYKVDLYANDNKVLKDMYLHPNKDTDAMIQDLVFKHQLIKTPEIEIFVKNKKTFPLNQYFDMRDFNQQLNQSLTVKIDGKAKTKKI